VNIRRAERYMSMIRGGWTRIFPVYARTRVSVDRHGFRYSKTGRNWSRAGVIVKKKKRHERMEAGRSSS